MQSPQTRESILIHHIPGLSGALREIFEKYLKRPYTEEVKIRATGGDPESKSPFFDGLPDTVAGKSAITGKSGYEVKRLEIELLETLSHFFADLDHDGKAGLGFDCEIVGCDTWGGAQYQPPSTAALRHITHDCIERIQARHLAEIDASESLSPTKKAAEKARIQAQYREILQGNTNKIPVKSAIESHLFPHLAQVTPEQIYGDNDYLLLLLRKKTQVSSPRRRTRAQPSMLARQNTTLRGGRGGNLYAVAIHFDAGSNRYFFYDPQQEQEDREEVVPEKIFIQFHTHTNEVIISQSSLELTGIGLRIKASIRLKQQLQREDSERMAIDQMIEKAVQTAGEPHGKRVIAPTTTAMMVQALNRAINKLTHHKPPASERDSRTTKYELLLPSELLASLTQQRLMQPTAPPRSALIPYQPNPFLLYYYWLLARLSEQRDLPATKPADSGKDSQPPYEEKEDVRPSPSLSTSSHSLPVVEKKEIEEAHVTPSSTSEKVEVAEKKAEQSTVNETTPLIQKEKKKGNAQRRQKTPSIMFGGSRLPGSGHGSESICYSAKGQGRSLNRSCCGERNIPKDIYPSI